MRRKRELWKRRIVILAMIVGMIVVLFYISRSIFQKRQKSNQLLTDQETEELEDPSADTEQAVIEKGYDLPVSEEDAQEAKADCNEIVTKIQEDASSLQSVIQEKGAPYYGTDVYQELTNYEEMEQFIEAAQDRERAEVVVYKLLSGDSFSRVKFYFDGSEMYYLYTNVVWSANAEPLINESTYTRIKEWNYTEKGWFFYELCEPEEPEVTEVVDGSLMMRVKPMDAENKAIAEKYLLSIGYQGNNLFCSEWSESQMDSLDYNALYEYLYAINTGERLDQEIYTDGIPREEFEKMMTQYLPITAESLESYAVYDAEKEVYQWSRLGCLTYSPNDFGGAIPEIVDQKENEDGTITFTIDAVSETLKTDQLFTHELTVRFTEEGGIQYLENKILEDGSENIPKYQYRISS